MKRTLNKKVTVTTKEILSRILIILLVSVLAIYSNDSQKEVITTGVFFLSFCGSIYLHRFFFPVITASIFFFLVASMQDLWHEGYEHLPITRTYWFLGNLLLAVGIVDLVWKIVFKFKIKKDER